MHRLLAHGWAPTWSNRMNTSVFRIGGMRLTQKLTIPFVLVLSVTDFRGSGARERRGMERRPRPNLDGKATREGEPATLDL
jgi:hypothetical protein